MSRLPPARTELDLAVAEGFLTQSDLGRLVAGGADAQAELRARLGDQAWARLEAQAAELRAVGAEDQILVDELPGRYRPHQDPRRTEPREIGHGAQGAVQVVWDAQLERDVAMKVLRPGMSSARFVREARVLSRLDHPALPTLYELGRSSAGLLYFTMRYIQGRPISEAARHLPLREVIDLFMRICEVITYAHSRGVIHRDLKPEHLVVGEYGRVAVLDWGLARVLDLPDPETPAAPTNIPGGVTAVGLALGTPGFRAPEQERGEPAGPAADIYALGRVLLLLLPDPAVAPLRSVALKATAQCPDQRYEHVAALVEELRRWRDHGLVQAHRYSLPERLTTQTRRHSRALSALAAFALIGLLLVAGYAQRQRQIQAPLYLKAAWQTLEDDGDPAVAQVLAAAALRIEDSPEARGALIAAMSRWRPRLLSVHRGPSTDQPCTVVALHPTGTWACMGDHHVGIKVFGADGAETVWDNHADRLRYLNWGVSNTGLLTYNIVSLMDRSPPTSGFALRGFGRFSALTGIIEGPSSCTRNAVWRDESTFVVGWVRDQQLEVVEFSVDRSQPLWTARIPTTSPGVGSLSAIGERLFLTTVLGEIFELDLRTQGQIVQRYDAGGVGSLNIALSERFMALVGTTGAEAPTRLTLAPIPQRPTSAAQDAFSPRALTTASIELGLQAPFTLHWLPDGVALVARSTVSGGIVMITPEDRQLLTSFSLPPLRADSYSSFKQGMASPTEDELLILAGPSPDLYTFSLKGRRAPSTMRVSSGVANRARFSEDGQTLLATGRGVALAVLDLATPIPTRVLTLPQETIGESLAFTSSRAYAYHYGADGKPETRAIALDTLSIGAASSLGPAESLAVSPDGRWLAQGNGDGDASVVIARADSLHVASRQKLFPSSIFSVLWRRGGAQLLATSFTTGGVSAEVLPNGTLGAIQPIAGLDGSIGHASLSDDERYLAYGGRDANDVFQLDLETGQRLPALTGHMRWPIMVAQGVVPGHGDVLASASWDGTLRLWTRDRPLAVLWGHQGQLWDTDISPDGRMVSSAGADGTARIWRLFVDTDEDGDDDLDLLRITGEEALQDAYDRFGLILSDDGEVVYAPGWAPPGRR